MAKSLRQAGLEVVGHDREEDRADEFRELGALGLQRRQGG